jgi:uncharacterized protein (UPF0332 family)
MAAFHAAQAILFERGGAVPKAHAGVHAAFGQLAKVEPAIGRAHGRFLAAAYRHKQSSDHDTDSMIAESEASRAIQEVAGLLAAVEAVLAPPSSA